MPGLLETQQKTHLPQVQESAGIEMSFYDWLIVAISNSRPTENR